MIKLQNILEKFYPEYLKVYKISEYNAKVINALLECRTAKLGGHVYECDDCGNKTIVYNSCRNRHCNQCQNISKEIWIDAKNNDVLNAPYFHVVFTVPEELKILIYQNQKLLYNLLYKSVAETLSELSQDPKYLDAQIGFMTILHTWSQDLVYHPHIHAVVLGGGLSKNNEFKQCSNQFFLPVKVLSALFRGKFLDTLKKYYNENQLAFYNEAREYENPECFKALLTSCYKKKWYIYSKKTFKNPVAVINYLSKYTHRVAIANERIVAMTDTDVTIIVKDRKKGNMPKKVTMKGVEFVRRFIMHILPRAFVKIRYYGVLSNRNKKTKLELCRYLTHTPDYIPKYKGMTKIEILNKVSGKDISKCPCCKKGKMTIVTSIPKQYTNT